MRSHEKEEEGRRDDNECAGSIDRGGVQDVSLSLSLCQLQNVGLTATMANGNGSFQRRRRNRFGINNFQMGQDLIEEHFNGRPT